MKSSRSPKSRFSALLFTLLVQGLIGGSLLAQSPTITALKADGTPALTKKNAGDTVTYTNQISNTGTGSATGVTFTDPDVNGAAVQMATLKVSPIAFDDTYTGIIVSGVGIDTSVGTNYSVTSNDYAGIYNNAAGVLTITAFDSVSVHGGAVSITTSGPNLGKFTYTSAAGYTGSDSFNYTISNTGFTSTGTVNLTVAGPGVFFVSTSGNDTTGKGTLAAPYATLTKVATLDANTSQRIFVFTGAYTAGMTLEANEQIIGQGVVGTSFDAVVLGVVPGSDSAARPAIGGTKPTITSASGDVITLADNNVIRGVTINSTVAGFAVKGSAIPSLQLGSTGTGTPAADTIVNSTGTSSGCLSLTGAATGTVNVTGQLTATVGNSVVITGRTGGTTSIIGKVTDNSSGISLSSNTGTTFNFRCLVLNTGTSAAFIATNGGTVNVTNGLTDGIDNDGDGTTDEADEANTITTTTGPALTVVNTTIGASRLTFRSISSNGATNAIFLSNTGSNGLTVTGDGASSGGFLVRNGTGGTIQNITADAVSFNNASDIVLRQMNITNAGRDGVQSIGGGNIVLSAVDINHPGNNNPVADGSSGNPAGFGGGNGWFAQNITGTNAINHNSRVFNWQSSQSNAVLVLNTNTNFTSFTMDRGLVTTSATGAAGFHGNMNGTSAGVFTVTSSEFTLIDQNGLQIFNNGSGTVTAFVQTCNFHDADNTSGDGNNTLYMSNAGSGLLNFKVGGSVAEGNTFKNLARLITLAGVIQIDASGGDNTTPAGSSLNGFIQNNNISNDAGFVNGRRAIDIEIEADNHSHGSHFVEISNNTINNVSKQGINILATSVSASGLGHLPGCNLRVLNNNVGATLPVGTEGNVDSASAFELETNFDSFTSGADIVINALVQGNTFVNSNTSGVGDTIDISNRGGAAGTTSTMNLTMLSNSITNLNAAGKAFDVLCSGGDTGAGSFLNLDLNSDNTTPNNTTIGASTLGEFQLRQTLGTFGIENLSGGVITFVSPRNNNDTVTVSGTQVAVGPVTNPTAPTAFLMLAPGGIEKASVIEVPALAATGLSPASVGVIQAEQVQSPVAATASAELPLLAQADLNTLVSAALQRWQTAGLTSDQTALLRGLSFEVTNLDGMRLGEAAGRTIRIDADAGGNGWYVDASDKLFDTVSSPTRFYTSPTAAPAGRLDLLTAIMHEMGHALGLEDSYLAADRDSLMYGFLTQGERRLPAMNQAVGATPHDDGVSHFLTGAISIGVLPPGKTVIITYDVIINNPSTTSTLSSQATVSGGNFANVLTDDLITLGDPSLPGAADPTVTLINQPQVNVVVTGSPVNEDSGSPMTYTFTRGGATTSAMTVNFSTSGSGAAPGTDFSVASGTGTVAYSTGTGLGTIIIPIGSATATLTVTPVTDSAVEANETVVVNVATGTGYDIGTVSPSATGTINNDDTGVQIDALPDTSLFEDQTLNFSYTFRRLGLTTGTTTVNFSVGGSATFGTDYTQSGATTFTTTTGTVVFAPGVTTVVVTLDPTDDNLVEGNETINLTVTSGTGYIPIAPNTQTATIVDDDVNVSLSSVVSSSVAEDSGTGMVYTFTRSGGSVSNALIVNVAISGTAGLTGDYSRSGFSSNNNTGSETITFAGGATTKTVTITPSADVTSESNETVILTVAPNGTPAVTGGYAVAAPPNNAATGTILDDDTQVSVAVTPSSVGESSATPMVYTFTRTGSTAAALTANFTITGTASFAASDYSITASLPNTVNGGAGTGTVTFGIGSSTSTISVTPLSDTIVEANETVIAAVVTGTGYAPAAGPNNVATGTITDDDTATESIAKITDGNEGPPIVNGKFRITQTLASSTSTVVNYSIAGTATPGAGFDYATLSGTATILPGNLTTDVDVIVQADAVAGEPTETVIVTLTTLGGGTNAGISIGAPNSATVNIGDAAVSIVTGDTAVGTDGTTPIGRYNLLDPSGSLNPSGIYAFAGSLIVAAGPPTVTASNAFGIWAKTGAADAFRLLARTGSVAPGTGNALFDSLAAPLLTTDVSSNEGDVIFQGSLRVGTGSPAVTASNDTGIWTTSSVFGVNPVPALMAREGSALAPPSNAVITRFGSGGVTGTGTGSAKAFTFYAIQSNGKSGLYVMTMNGGNPQAAVTTALEGDVVPNGGGGVWDSFVASSQEPTRMDPAGNYAWTGRLSNAKTGVFYAPIATGLAAKVTITGDAAPGTTTTFQSLDSVVMGDVNNIAFHGVLGATGDNASGLRSEGIWRGVAPAAISTYGLVLRRGDNNAARAGLGLPSAADKVGRISGGWLTPANHGAWLGELDAGGDGTRIPAPGDVQAIYSDLSGTMKLVVKQGDAAPGMPGATFASLEVPAVGGVEQMAFLATAEGGGRAAGTNKGLWRSAANGGALTLVLRTGGPLSTAQGTKIISNIAFANSGAVASRPAQRVMDSTGRLMVQVSFTDGGSGEVLLGIGGDASSATVTVTNPAITTGSKGTAFSQTFTQTGGTLPVVFTTTSRLPLGLTLAGNGTLSGTPTQSGTFSITVTATDALGNTAAGSAYVLIISSPTTPEIDLQGNAISIASGDLSPAAADGTDFGSISVSGGTVVRTFSIVNTGTATLQLIGTPKVAISGANAAEFTVTASPGSTVAAPGSTTFDITFNPSTAGVRTATVTVENDDVDESSYTFVIQGTGAAEPEIAFYEAAGSYRVDAGPLWDTNPPTFSGVEEAAILFGGSAGSYSTSTSATTVSQTAWHSVWGVSGGVEKPDDYKLGTNYNVGVIGGSSSAYVLDNALGAAFTNYAWRLATTHAFPVTASGVTSAVQTFAIKNLGASALTITSATLTGDHPGDFVLNTTGMLASVPSGGTTTLTVAFSPTMFGLRQAILHIVNNDPDEATTDIILSGTGTGPEIDVTGNAVPLASGDTTPATTDGTDFGSTPVVGGTIVRIFTITNPGTATLNLTGSPKVAVSGSNASDFSVTTQPLSTVSSGGGTTTFQVTFDPSAGGLRAATLTIASDDTDENPFTLSIQGTGIPLPIVTGIAPATGPTTGGTSVIITGSYFTGATGAAGVKFGATNATSYTVDSDTQVTAISPPGTLTVHITVTAAGGTSLTSPADQYTYGVGPPVTLLTSGVTSPPGAPGTTFASMRSGMALASSGALTFRAYLTMGTGGVDANNFMGIWKSSDGTSAATALVARSGSAAPDANGALFDILPVNAVINNAAQTSFAGFLRIGGGSPPATSSTDTGVWSELGTGVVHLLLREGTAITGGTVTAVAPSTWVATGATKAAFTVQFASGSALVRGGFTGTTPAITTLATEGGAAPGGGTFDSFVGNSADPRMDATDDVAFLGYLQTSGTAGIWYQAAAGSLVTVVKGGQATVGITDTFTAFERPSLGSSTSVAFRAFLTTNGQSVFRGNPATPSSIMPVAVTGYTSAQIATIPAGRKLWSIWSPFTNVFGHVAFRVSLVDTATSANESRAIVTDTSSTMTVIAKVGDIAPGVGVETFANFDHPVIGDADEAAFVASTNAGTVGVWRQSPGGTALQLVAKVGDTLTINGVTETIASMVIPGTSTDDRKYETKTVDGAGHVLIHITYASGKTGVLLSGL